jgi:superfamily II DNA or RNA helicase
MARLLRLGRLLALLPAELGNQFRDVCTVTRTIKERPSPANGWVEQTVYEPNQLWWEDVDPISGQRAFCALAGYEHHIVSTLKSLGIPVEIEQRVDSGLGRPDFSRMGNIELRVHQREMLVKLCASNGGLFVAATGAGKSTLIKLVARIYPEARIVVTVPSVDIARDLYEALAGVPDLTGQIGMVGDGERNVQRITVCVTHSIAHCPPEANLVLCDEAHMFLTKRFIKALNHFYRAKFFGFTASPDGKSDGSDAFMQAIFGPVLAASDYQDSVDVRSVVPIEVRQVQSAKGPDLSGVTADHQRERLGVIANKARNELIASTTRSLMQELGPQAQILLMTSKVEHVFRLQQLLPEFQIVTAQVDTKRLEELKKCGAYNPDTQQPCSPADRDRRKRDFSSGELKYVIANSVWERGVDFKDLACLVRADGAASPIKAIQITGRLSRTGSDGKKEKGLLVDFNDTFDKGMKRKSAKRFAEYRKQGWNVTRVTT